MVILKKPIHLACLIGQLGFGGTERQLYYFLKNCDRSLLEPEVWTFQQSGKWESAYKEVNVKINKIPSNISFQRAYQIRRLAVGRKIDLVWSWSYYTNSYLAFLPRNIQSIGSLRGSLQYCRKSVGMFFSLCEHGFRTIVVNSSELKQEITHTRYPGDVVLIGNMTYPYSISEEKRTYWRQHFGVKENDRLIVGVGRLDKNKNFSLLIQAMAHLDLQNCITTIIGDGPERENLAKLASSLGLKDVISFPGEVKDAIEIIASADLLVHPSFSEGMPNVVAEAIASATPVISTCVNGVEDLIPSPDYGWRVPVNNILSMQFAIQEALTYPHEARKKARLAKSRLVDTFSPTKITKKMENLIVDSLALKKNG